MVNLFALVGRAILGVIALAALWFVLDTIHDRNTEIIVSCIGSLYTLVFMLSLRTHFFRLTLLSHLDRSAAYTQKLPFDANDMGGEIGLEPRETRFHLGAIFAALAKILCLFRLFSSLLGFGWGLLADPVHNILQSSAFFR
jgi:hypothetical protein